ncbi:short-chain dehydrogenase TIC 32, chloroplastic-like [Chenopodium quinoa]|uniref:short-chain dehydrogenase TIC 32, chloroplastic-like n=1 Tax=Chenopodium quinoa TaxID=63459 RepID=UPI000B78DE31|nr:short-chain dehydrogenase TIC 32, chloroplastic-like [Chenopodium quinoa]
MWFFGRKNSSGFSASSSAKEVTHGIDGTGLTAIVTGASSGIGAETSRILALRGVHVIMLDKNMAAGTKVRNKILEKTPSAKVDIVELDLSSMASIRNFASEFKSLNQPLNILINNAGVFGCPFTLSQDNIELQFAVNYLGHFLLTHLLLDTMKNTVLESGIQGRIVNVSSIFHLFTYRKGILFYELNDPSRYSRCAAYGQSKLAKILHVRELAKQLKDDGVNIIANAVHPGYVYTKIVKSNRLVDAVNTLSRPINYFLTKDIPQGAATTCYVALHPQVKGISGEYFNDCDLAKPSKLAQDNTLARKLWEFSMELVK